MREILFRGKRVDNGGWVEGYYAVKGKDTDLEKHFIVTSTFDSNTNAYPFYFTDNLVDPETVCQYTGLTDKNDRKIFEGDIVKYSTSGSIGAVKWYRKMYTGWYVDDIRMGNQQFTDDMWEECEVVGNIFDNPELIGDQP